MHISYTDGTICETWAHGLVYYLPHTLPLRFCAIKPDSTANIPHISARSKPFPAYTLYLAAPRSDSTAQ